MAAIVVYFRTPECLNSCLDGLRAQTAPPDAIVVVDNSSAVDGLDQRPGRGDDYSWVRAEHNLGFGAACNLGARMTESEYLLFLNADLILRDQACERLHRAAEHEPGIGVVGPRVYAADGSIELSAREFPTIATGLLGRSSSVTKVLGAIGRAPQGVSRALGASGPVDWVSGACMLIRRSAFQEVAGFDEAYWMYWEDADICYRLKQRGWMTMLSVDAEARHITGSSGRSERTIEAFHASAARYFGLHVARTSVTAGMARRALQVRMRMMRRHHAHRRA